MFSTQQVQVCSDWFADDSKNKTLNANDMQLFLFSISCTFLKQVCFYTILSPESKPVEESYNV